MMISLCGCSSLSSAKEEITKKAEESFTLAEDVLDQFDEGLQVERSTGDFEQGLQSFSQNGYDSYGNDLSFEDFDFYYDLMYYGIPEEAYFPALKYAEGSWKYDLKIRYDSSDGYMFDEIGYADLTIDRERGALVVTLHPRLASDGYEVWPESDEEVGYEPFDGGFDENGALKLIGNYCVLYVENYYAYEGREYMLGTLWMSEDSFADFLMMRGQN